LTAERKLHIVCFDVPYPADYGGVMDVFHRIKTLKEAGIGIILHCFSYRRPKQNCLQELCDAVYYYERQTGWKGFSFPQPYIVSSRKNDLLLDTILKDDHPVLLEGVHCTSFIDKLSEKGRKVVLRSQNVETEYYRHLYKWESNLFKKCYYRFESYLLAQYEARLPDALPVLCICEKDASVYRQRFNKKNVFVLPAFVPYSGITSKEGMGNFCLYHGNLSVAENEKAALWLLKKVFTSIKVPFVIAGKNPSRRLRQMAHLCQHTCLVADPDEKEMNDLIEKAHIHVLPSFNNTGVKLKLLTALAAGKHCIVNAAAVDGSGLEPLCHVATTSHAFVSVVAQLYHQPFTAEEIRLRTEVMGKNFNNRENARKLIQHLW